MKRHMRFGLGAAALATASAVAFASIPPASVLARTQAAAATAAPRPAANRRAPASQPTPIPVHTLAPLGGASLPYPAYGTPVPGVDAGSPAPDVPATIGLQQAILIGFARNPTLASARADIGVQAAAVRLQRAGLLPSFSGSAGLTQTHQQVGGTTAGLATGTAGGATRSFDNVTSASFGLDLRQLIYDGGKVAASVNAARRSETAFVDTYKRDLQTIAYNVAVAYYNYLAAQRTTQVNLELVREDVVQEDLVRAQVRAGAEARAQIATTQLPTAQARLAVVRSQGNELSTEAAFANAMGLDANTKVQPIDDAPVFTNAAISSVTIPSYDLAVRRALALRPDYDAFVQTVESAKYLLRAAKLGLFPTLSAQGTAQDGSTDASLGSFRNSQSLGLALSIPIFDQGVTAANTASAQAQLERANAQLRNTGLGVQLNVKQSLTGMVTARAALDQTQQEYATAISNVRSTQAQYRAGVTTLPLLLNAQVQLTSALTDQVTAVYTLRQAEQAYLFAVGANYEVPVGNLDVPVSPSPAPTSGAGK